MACSPDKVYAYASGIQHGMMFSRSLTIFTYNIIISLALVYYIYLKTE